MGYLYVMEVPKLKCVKIGISEHEVTKRQRMIQTGCPEKIERVWCSRNIPDYRELEKLMHQRFMSKRKNGEWFEVPFFEACEEADRLCATGKDAEQVRILQEENKRLKQQLQKTYTIDEFITATIMAISAYLPER